MEQILKTLRKIGKHVFFSKFDVFTENSVFFLLLLFFFLFCFVFVFVDVRRLPTC